MALTALNSGAVLHHIALESGRPRELASFYASALDMRAEEVGDGLWRCVGSNRRIAFLPGTSGKLAFAGFACRDRAGLDQLRRRADDERLETMPAPAPWFGADAFAIRDPDGNVIAFGLSEDRAAPESGLHGPLQHFALATFDVEALLGFYRDRLGFALSDRVVRDNGEVTTGFLRSSPEHHTIACFKSSRLGIDHHSYEAGAWNTIRDWCDHFAALRVPLVWGPGRHGPGNNLFVFIADPDGNRIEVSAELETIEDRPVADWPHDERTFNLWGPAIMRVE